MFAADLKKLWLSISDVSLPLAEVRDEYLAFKGGEIRFMQLTDAYSNLNTMEQALFEHMETKAPLLGKKRDRELLMVAQVALDNAKILLALARDEVARLRRTVSC